jgi:tRNA 2-selenouridine synthase
LVPMPVTKLHIADFLELKYRAPLLDVRSPGEFAHAHIPGAESLPLFNNEERATIGTAYKQESREKAIKIGLGSFGKNLVSLVEEVEKISSAAGNSREIGVHCWRGGMRSAAVAWLLDLYGFKVYVLTGGYKAYRHWVLQQFEKPRPFHILGGYTGSNKTGALVELRKQGEPVIDLEGLAGHKGSAFGNLNRNLQPTQEMFENLLATELTKHDPDKAVWIEDESQRIGMLNIPHPLFATIRNQPFVFLDIAFEQRLEHLLAEYGKYDKEKFINAILRIKKRLGGLETKQAVNCLLEEDIRGCFTVLLKYYDKIYLRNRVDRKESESIPIVCATTDASLNSQKLIRHVRNN